MGSPELMVENTLSVTELLASFILNRKLASPLINRESGYDTTPLWVTLKKTIEPSAGVVPPSWYTRPYSKHIPGGAKGSFIVLNV